MSTRFPRVCVVGLGLIGGSFAMSVKRLDDAPQVLGVDVDPAVLEYALEHGIADQVASPDAAFEQDWFGPDGVELVVLATPAAAAAEWLSRLAGAGHVGVITDAASTKSGVIRAARELGPHASFVGGHPMAGSELSGITAARPDLFDGAYYVLTPTDSTDPDAYRRLHSFVGSLGARVISVDAAEHDRAVAIISHVPHVTASALVKLAKSHAGEGDELMRLAAGGFKDTTRIAAGSPELWTGICLDNAEALASGIDDLTRMLGEFADSVRNRDAQAIHAWLERAANVRRALPAQWVPATEQLTELRIPMIDRPGVVSEITNAVGRAGCNIEAIEIDHQSESTAVLVLVLTDEGDFERLAGDLTALGYEPRLQPLEA
ncbi:MAG: prephenate dehydrogenase [Coriobacteriia bacterium]